FLTGGPSFDVTAVGPGRTVTFDHLDLDAAQFLPVLNVAAVQVESGASAELNATPLAGRGFFLGPHRGGAATALVPTSLVTSTISGTTIALSTSGQFPTINAILISNSTITGNETGIEDNGATPSATDPVLIMHIQNSIVAGNQADFAFTNFESAYAF